MGRPLTYKDFSGGFTDHYLDGPLNSCQKNENLLIDANLKIFNRYGQNPYSATYPLAVSGNGRINALINHDNENALLVSSARKLFYLGTGWSELLGPTGNPSLSAGDDTNNISYGSWKSHTFITNDGGSSLMKVYRNNANALQVRNAGLPQLSEAVNYVEATVLANAITLANAIKTALLLHFSDWGVFDNTLGDNVFVPTNASATSGNPTLSSIASTVGIANGFFVKNAPNPDTDLTSVAANTNVTVSSTTASTVVMSGNALLSGTYYFYYNNLNVAVAQHWAYDSAAYTTLNAVANATDLPTLITLTNAIKNVFTNHISDTIKIFDRSFHHEDGNATSPPGSYLLLDGSTENPDLTVNAPDDVTSLVEAVEVLRDVYQKYSSHNEAYNTHGAVGTNPISGSNLTALTSGPQVEGNNEELFIFLNQLKSDFNDHIADTNMHHSDGTDEYEVVAADAVDIYTAWNLSIALYHQVTSHLIDSTYEFLAFTGDFTSGNDEITNVSPSATGLNLVPHYIYSANVVSSSPRVKVLTVTIGGTVIGMNVNATSSGVGQPFIVTRSKYHTGEFTGSFTFSTIPDFNDVESIRNEMVKVYNDYVAHDQNFVVHDFPVGIHFTEYTLPTIGSYAYALLYFYEYQVGSLTFQDFGPVTYTNIALGSFTNANGNELTNISVIANGSTENWDTSNIKVRIYRTIDSGTVYYQVGEITNGTTTFTDNTPDSEILSAEKIYVNGGVVENDLPPKAKYIHILNNTAYFLNTTDSSGDVDTSKLMQSVYDDPDSVPATFFTNLNEAGTGISSYTGKVIAFSEVSVYRVDGSFDELGRGFMTVEKIYDVDGCVNNNSIVQIPQGLVYAGRSGFYFTDGYKVLKLTEHLNTSYSQLVSSAARKKQIQGEFDPVNNQVWWTCTDDGGDGNLIWVLDLKFGTTPTSTFSKIKSLGTSLKATNLLYFGGNMLRGDARGYPLKFDPTTQLDPYFNSSNLLQTGGYPIIYDYVSCATDFGTPFVRKWVPKMKFTIENQNTNLTLRIESINDSARQTASLKEVFIRGGSGIREQKRWMPKENLRCSYKQIRFTNSYISGSDPIIEEGVTYGTINTNAGTGVVTLNTGTWPVAADIEGNILYLNDTSTTLYIKTRTGNTTLSILNIADMATLSGVQNWEIRSVGAKEKVRFIEYTIDYSLRTMSLDTYKGDSSDSGVTP